MPLEQLAVILKARWGVVALTWIAIVGAALAVSLALPPRYVAKAEVAVQTAGLDPLVAQPVYRPTDDVSNQVATQIDILKSDEVARGAVRSLGLEKRGEWRAAWLRKTDGQGDFEAWAAHELLRKTGVSQVSRKSNALALSYVSPDPRFSAAAANALIRSYMNTTLQMQVGPARQFNAFFAERAKPLRAALERARGRLTAYEKKHGVIVGDEPDAERARLAELNFRLVSLQDAAAQAAKRSRQASVSPADLSEVRDDPEVAALTDELVRQQGNLAELRSQFGERYPSVVQARKAIGDAKRRLAAAMSRAAETVKAHAKVIETRLAGVRAAVERERALVLKRKAERDAAAALLRDVDSAQKAYDAVLAGASQTALESKNDVQTTVSVLKYATPPLWSPLVLIRNLIVAAFVGLLLGVARAVLAERRDRRVRTIADITERLQRPLLLALPDGDAHGRGRSDEARKRLVSTTPLLPAPKRSPAL